MTITEQLAKVLKKTVAHCPEPRDDMHWMHEARAALAAYEANKAAQGQDIEAVEAFEKILEWAHTGLSQWSIDQADYEDVYKCEEVLRAVLPKMDRP
jgi:hypothetical protein